MARLYCLTQLGMLLMGVRDARRPSATDKMSVVPAGRQDGGSPYGCDKRPVALRRPSRRDGPPGAAREDARPPAAVTRAGPSRARSGASSTSRRHSSGRRARRSAG